MPSKHFQHSMTLVIVSASASDEIKATAGKLIREQRMELWLRADHDCEVCLPDGSSLSNHDICLTLIPATDPSCSSSAKLDANEIGCLMQAAREGKGPFLYGLLEWPSILMPHYLLASGVDRRMGLTIATFPQIADWEEPHVWAVDQRLVLTKAWFVAEQPRP